MKAIGYKKPCAIDEPNALIKFDAPKPTAMGEHDLIVKVLGISVNPVDTKVRSNMGPEKEGDIKIIGYDAAGVVQQVGSAVTSYKEGDHVFYAGDYTRPGTNSSLHIVDERIVGMKPTSLDFAEAAAFLLTSITAWEMLFDCFRIQEGGGEGESILIVGAAGGVGSILIQLAKN
jgi:NADPH2:quinone reductase